MILTTLYIVVSLILCLLAADFASGLFHWAEDTWLAPGTIFDKYVTMPNIEHHRAPGKMKYATYLESNLVTMALTLIFVVIAVLCKVHAWQVYLTLAIATHSNQYHKWAHMRNVPGWVQFLQKLGILQSVEHHGVHHKRPYASRFCTTTNYLNPILDTIRFWRGLEAVISSFGITVVRATEARGGY